MLQTRKLYSIRPLLQAREEAQCCADQDQRPAAVYNHKSGRYRFSVEPHYRTLEDIRRRNAALGHHWFSADTMRFFSSRVQERIYVAKDGRAFFVTSERSGGCNPGSYDIRYTVPRRLYTVRVANLDGSIDTVGEFQQYTTGRQAHAAARKAAQS